MFIQDSPTNGTYTWIYKYMYGSPTITSINALFIQNPIKSCSATWILLMWWQIPVTRSERSLLDTTRSLKLLPCSTPWLTLHSPYLLWLRVMDVSGSSTLSPSISPMFQTFEKSSDWKDEQTFYPLRSMDRTWLISREIAKWSKSNHRWLDLPIWRCPWQTRTSTC